MKTRGNYLTESGSLRENVRPGGWGGGWLPIATMSVLLNKRTDELELVNTRCLFHKFNEIYRNLHMGVYIISNTDKINFYLFNHLTNF